MILKGRELANWNIGAFCSFEGIFFKLSDWLKILEISNPIKTVFGAPNCSWNGGRVATKTLTIDEVKKYIDEWNNRGIGCRFTFSRYDVEDVDDIFCNTLLDYADSMSSLNGVIVSSDKLAEHIKSKYPRLNLIASLVKSTYEKGRTPEYFNELIDRYDCVVIPSEYASNNEFLGNLKNKLKTEFIVNHTCRQFCDFADKHYTAMNNVDKAIRNGYREEYDKAWAESMGYVNKCHKLRVLNPFNSCFMSDEKIDNLIKKGFVNLKIEGRDYNAAVFVREVGQYIFERSKYTSLMLAIYAELEANNQ